MTLWPIKIPNVITASTMHLYYSMKHKKADCITEPVGKVAINQSN